MLSFRVCWRGGIFPHELPVYRWSAFFRSSSRLSVICILRTPGRAGQYWRETMATPSEENIPRSSMAAVIFSSTLGTAIEWYDFFLYGTMATLVFPTVFFPASDKVVGTLLSLFTFLVGFVARPFGGALFGHLGDRIGRKSTLIATLL